MTWSNVPSWPGGRLELARAVKDPKIVQMMETNGFAPVGNTPDESAKSLRAEVDLNRDLVRKFPDIK